MGRYSMAGKYLFALVLIAAAAVAALPGGGRAAPGAVPDIRSVHGVS